MPKRHVILCYKCIQQAQFFCFFCSRGACDEHVVLVKDEQTKRTRSVCEDCYARGLGGSDENEAK